MANDTTDNSSDDQVDAAQGAPADEPGEPRKLENRTLWEQVRERLREDILSGDLEPGTVLSEVALANSFGVSRGPIREALGRLASEGLVTITPRRGAIVTELSTDEFIEAYQLREALETFAIKLAAPRLSAGDLETLRDLQAQMVEHARRDEVNAFFDANGAFHDLIVAASGNRKLRESYRLLMDQMGRYLAHSLALRGSLERSVAEHSAILEALEAGDSERAARLLADHIETPQRVEEETGEHTSTNSPTATEGSQS